MSSERLQEHFDAAAGDPPTADFPEGAAAHPPAWEEIEDGRYQPRRVRGSCIGRELG
jgi:hypothetical protein